MTRALIGHTGFVGGTLLRQAGFDDAYNSKNIDEIRGRSYDLVVCAGAPAAKWIANREPARDRAGLQRLADCLDTVTAARFLLISTIDVYPVPVGVDEDAPIDPARAVPYGAHRRELELRVVRRFATRHILRLPGLFGAGLKKNVVYDFLHGNNVEQIHADSVFQFYDMENLWKDVGRTVGAGLELVNLATEPISVCEVAREGFGMTFENRPPGASPARYDFRTRHAAQFGGRDGYAYNRRQVLDGLRAFVATQRAGTHA